MGNLQAQVNQNTSDIALVKAQRALSTDIQTLGQLNWTPEGLLLTTYGANPPYDQELVLSPPIL